MLKNQSDTFWECQHWNLGMLGEKCNSSLCATMTPSRHSYCVWFERSHLLFFPGQIIDLKLYNLGGFSLPFFCIGTYAIVASLMFCLAVPGFEAGEEKEMQMQETNPEEEMGREERKERDDWEGDHQQERAQTRAGRYYYRNPLYRHRYPPGELYDAYTSLLIRHPSDGEGNRYG